MQNDPNNIHDALDDFNTSNNDYQGNNNYDPSLDTSAPPDDIPFPEFGDLPPHGATGSDELTEQELEENRNLNALASIITNNNKPEILENNPSAKAASIDIANAEPVVDAQNSTLADFINHKYNNSKNLDIGKPITKNTQSNWFEEFNEFQAGSANSIICKPNGFFYKQEESIADALQNFGLTSDEAQNLSHHFQFSFIGLTNTRYKDTSNQNGFKSFVLQLKTPLDPDSILALEKISIARNKIIENTINSSPNLESATQALVDKIPSILSNDIEKNKSQPFVSVGENYFLNQSAVYSQLNKIPEIRDKFKVEIIKDKENKSSYVGYSKGLNSYFEENLGLCKVVATKPNELSQEALEIIITEHLQNFETHLAQTPKEAFKQRIDSEVEPQNATDKNQQPLTNDDKVKNIKPQTPPQNEGQSFQGPKTDFNQKGKKDVDNPEQQVENNQNKKNNKEKEPKSLAKLAVEGASKATSAVLKAIMEIALKLAIAIVALLHAFVSMATKLINKKFGNFPTVPFPTKEGYLSKVGWNNPSNGSSNDNNPTSSKEVSANSNNIKNALDDVLDGGKLDSTKDKNSDVKKDLSNTNSIDDELKLLGIDSIDRQKITSDLVNDLTDDEKASLQNSVNDKIRSLDADSKDELLNSLDLPTLHHFANKTPKISSQSLLHDKHGLLLAENDAVSINDENYAVVSAFDVAGELYYGLAKEDLNGEYQVTYEKAENLTLTGHNVYNIDNFDNLKNQINDSINGNLEFKSDLITQIEILNTSLTNDKSLSIREMVEKFPPSSAALSELKISDLVKDNNHINDLINSSHHQLHINASGVKDGSRSNIHPIYGEMLDINDSISAKLPKSDIEIKGSVVGAFIKNNDLFYAIETNGQFYNFKAQDITLNAHDGGELSEERAIALFLSDKLPIGSGVKGVKTVPLFDAGALKKELPISHDNSNDSIIQGLSNIRLSPLINDEHTPQLITIKHTKAKNLLPTLDADDTLHKAQIRMNKEFSFVTIGHTIDPITGAKNAIGFEVNKSILGVKEKSLDKSRLVQINLDDPRVNIQSNGITKQSVLDAASKIKDIYTKGVSRKAAEIISLNSDVVKELEVLEKDKLKDAAKESFINKEALISILEDESKTPSSKATMGLDSNLSNTTIDNSNIVKAIDTPASSTPSQSYVENSDLVSNHFTQTTNYPLDNLGQLPLVGNSTLSQILENGLAYSASIHTQTQPTSEILENVESDNAIADTLNTEIKSDISNTSIDENNSSMSHETKNPVTPPDVHVEQTNDLISKARNEASNSDFGRIFKFAMMYASGERVANNRDNAIDLLSDKNELAERQADLLKGIQEITHQIKDGFEAIETSNLGVPNLMLSQVKDINKIQDDILQQPSILLSFENLISDHEEYNELMNDHIDKLGAQVQKISGNIDLSSIDLEQQADLSGAEQLLKSVVGQNLQNINDINNFVAIVDKVKNNESDSSYGEIVKNVAISSSNNVDLINDKVQEFSLTKNISKKSIEPNEQNNTLEM